jgi:hypothetical protein
MESNVRFTALLVALVSVVGCASSLPIAEEATGHEPPAEELDMSPPGGDPIHANPGEFVEMTWTDTPRPVAPRRVIQTTRAVKPTMATGKKTQLFAVPQSGGAAFTPADAAK